MPCGASSSTWRHPFHGADRRKKRLRSAPSCGCSSVEIPGNDKKGRWRERRARRHRKADARGTAPSARGRGWSRTEPLAARSSAAVGDVGAGTSAFSPRWKRPTANFRAWRLAAMASAHPDPAPWRRGDGRRFASSAPRPKMSAVSIRPADNAPVEPLGRPCEVKWATWVIAPLTFEFQRQTR